MSVLISVEGGEFTGKSTFVIPLIKDVLHCLGYEVIVSREPGGCKDAEIIREKIFELQKNNADPMLLTTLFNKARQIHLKEKIIPAMGQLREKNTIVILDRYLDSTRVYQGLEGNIDMDKIIKMEKKYVGDWYPNLTFILYLKPERFERILKHRQKISRSNISSNGRDQTGWDSQKIAEHLNRQLLYLSLPKISEQYNENRLFVAIDASLNPSHVIKLCIKEILKTVKKYNLLPENIFKNKIDNCISNSLTSKLGSAILDLWDSEQKAINNI